MTELMFIGFSGLERTLTGKLRETPSILDAIPESEHEAICNGTSTYDCLPAFQDANEQLRGGRLLIPGGKYFLNGTWEIDKTFHVYGEASWNSKPLLQFPPNTTGIRVHGPATSSGNADGTVIEQLYLRCNDFSQTTTGHGIYVTTLAKIRDCAVQFFGGDGMYFYGHNGSGATNSNMWEVSHSKIYECKGNGLSHGGNDAQIGIATAVDCTLNKGWGFYNNTPYTNIYLGCHAAGNVLGDYMDAPNSAYMGGIYIGCYREGGGKCEFRAGSLVYGGNVSAAKATSYGTMGYGVPTGGTWTFNLNGLEAWRVDYNGVMKGLQGARFGNYPTNYGIIMGSEIALVAGITNNQTRITFHNPNGQIGSINTSGQQLIHTGKSNISITLDDILARLAAAGI